MAKVTRRQAVRKDTKDQSGYSILDFAGDLIQTGGQAYAGAQENVKQQEILQQKQQEAEQKRLQEIQDEAITTIQKGGIVDEEYLVNQIGNERAGQVFEVAKGGKVAKEVANQLMNDINNGNVVLGEGQTPIQLLRETLRARKLNQYQLEGANYFLMNNADSILKKSSDSLSDNAKFKIKESFGINLDTTLETIYNNNNLSREEKIKQLNQSYYNLEDEFVKAGLDIKEFRQIAYNLIESMVDDNYEKAVFFKQALETRTVNGKKVKGFTKTDQKWDDLTRKKELDYSIQQKSAINQLHNGETQPEVVSKNLDSGYENYRNLEEQFRGFVKNGTLTQSKYNSFVLAYQNGAKEKIKKDALASTIITTRSFDSNGNPVNITRDQKREMFLDDTGALSLDKIYRVFPDYKKMVKDNLISEDEVINQVKQGLLISNGDKTATQEDLDLIYSSLDISNDNLLFNGKQYNSQEEATMAFQRNIGRRYEVVKSLNIGQDIKAKEFYNNIQRGDSQRYSQMANTYKMMKERFPEDINKFFNENKQEEIETYLQDVENAKQKVEAGTAQNIQEGIEIVNKERAQRDIENNKANSEATKAFYNESGLGNYQNAVDYVSNSMGIGVGETELEVREQDSWVNNFGLFGDDVFTDTVNKDSTYYNITNDIVKKAQQEYQSGQYTTPQEAIDKVVENERLKDRTIPIDGQLVMIPKSKVDAYTDTNQMKSNFITGVRGLKDEFDDLIDYLSDDKQGSPVPILNYKSQNSEFFSFRQIPYEKIRLIKDKKGNYSLNLKGDYNNQALQSLLNNPKAIEYMKNNGILLPKLINQKSGSNNYLNVDDFYEYDRINKDKRMKSLRTNGNINERIETQPLWKRSGTR